MMNLSREQVGGILVKEVEDLCDPLSKAVGGREDSNRTAQLTSCI